MSVRLVFCLRRLDSLTLREFLDHWSDVHAPLVRERAGVLGISRYEQAHTLDGDPAAMVARLRGAPAPFDGVASIWFDSLDAFNAGGSTPEGRRAAQDLLEDERRFIDLAHSPIWLAADHRIV